MLKFENTQPNLLAYDKPSSKFLSFLGRHYNLNNYVVQSNNFIVFNEYFENQKSNKQIRTSSRGIYKNSLANLGQNLIHNRNLIGNNIPNNNFNQSKGDNYSGMNDPENNPNYISFQNNDNINYPSHVNNPNYNRDLYATPDKLFADYFLNRQNTNSYDQIYSKKKINLLNDYLSSTNGNIQPDEYVKQQLNFRKKELINSKDRVTQLENNIYHNQNNHNYYNKRNEYSTLFDDKKTLEKRINREHNRNSGFDNYNNNQDNSTINYSNQQQGYISHNRIPVKTNILPTTSSTYGAYYTNENNNYNQIFY